MAEWTVPTQDRVDVYFKELNNWGRWGNDDQRGTVNLITPAKRQAAQALVKTGRTVSLARDVTPQPVFMYSATFPSKRERADVVLDRFDMVYHGFWITHVDALCHVAWDGELYNGRSFADSLSVAGATWCPIDPLFDGITSRGVLLDVAAGRKEGYVTVGQPVTPKELDETARRQGVRVEPGDVLLVRTGYYARRRAEGPRSPLKDGSPAVHVAALPWIRERSVAMLGTDTHNDVTPLPYPKLGNALHVVSLVAMGMWLIDNANLEELAQACARYRRWEFMLTLAPLVLERVTGSPVNPIAVF